MKKNLKFIIYYLLLVNFILLPLSPALADFNPNNIISDVDILDSSSMSLNYLLQFLNNKGSYLVNYIVANSEGKFVNAAEAIYDRAVANGVSPKFLLVLLQKEQGLITEPAPTQNQLDWAAGYGCPDSGGCNPRWQGFWKQINSAALQFKDYVENPYSYSYRAGGTYVLNDRKNSAEPITSIITPANSGTASLYNYTPHVYEGNYNFWKIWQEWFTRVYPNGSILQAAGEPGIWLIQNSLRRPFHSYSAFASRYSKDKILTAAKEDLERYEIGQPINFANYSLLRSPRGTVYLLDGDIKRGIVSREVFKAIGFNPEEIIDVKWEELNNYSDGENITMKTVYPMGALLQDKKTGGIYYAENGNKHPIWSKEILKSNFKNRPITPTKPEILEQYQTGDPVKFKDGELVARKGDRSVYVVSDGQRRPISSEEVFNELGFKWGNIVWTDEKSLSLNPIGSPLMIGIDNVGMAAR